MVWHHLYFYALSLLTTTTFALNFTVNSTSLTSCRDVQLIWKGGQAPYTVTVVASQSYPENYSLSPSSSQVGVDPDGDMSWNYTITYPPGTHIAFIMSDATGLGTGGSTDVFLLADPGDGLDCYSNKAQPQGIDWMTYTDPNAPQQCKGASILWSTPSSETSPTYILGATPDQVLQFNAGTGMHKLVWDVDVAAGTSLLLQGWDAQTSMAIGRASPYINIASSGDTSCLPSAPLSSEGDSNSSTTTTPMRTVTATMTIVPPNNGLKGGEIAGLVVGILAFIVITQVMFYHFCWKKRLNAPFSRLRETKKSGEQEALDMTEFLDPFTFSASTTNLSTAVSSPIESERDPFRRATDDDPDEVLSAMAEFDKHSIRSISTHTEPVSSSNSPISAVSTTAILQRAQTPQADTYTHHSVHSHVNSYGRESSAEMTDTLQTTSSKERRLAGPRRIATTRSGRDAEGGVYVHEDAGRLARSRTEPVEDLPPRYDPSWQDS